jgi:hypothetical protein
MKEILEDILDAIYELEYQLTTGDNFDQCLWCMLVGLFFCAFILFLSSLFFALFHLKMFW